MSHVVSIPLGVVIAREKIDHPWQTYRWRPVSVFLDAPPVSHWRELRRVPRAVHYHAATLPLSLHRKETMAYRVNLANGEPSVYVVLREDPQADTDLPVAVHLVTASPFEAQSHGDIGLDQVEGVPMPERLVATLQAFIDEHHVEEQFHKRQRDRATKPEEHKFGQEPIFVLRERIGMPEPGSETEGRPEPGKSEQK